MKYSNLHSMFMFANPCPFWVGMVVGIFAKNVCSSGHFIQFLEKYFMVIYPQPHPAMVGKDDFSVQIWTFHAILSKIIIF